MSFGQNARLDIIGTRSGILARASMIRVGSPRALAMAAVATAATASASGFPASAASSFARAPWIAAPSQSPRYPHTVARAA